MSVLEIAWTWLTGPQNWAGPDSIPVRIVEHLAYSGLVFGVAAAIALPLGLLTGHTGKGSFVAVNSANAGRALPTLGLLVFVFLLTGGELPAVLVALVALAVPPILVNTYAGVREVDAQVRDAAEGMGMTGWQVLWRVEVPVALPLIVLGLRTAAIQVVATATVAAYVNVGGLGGYLMDGIQLRDYAQVAGGSVLVVTLALLVQLGFVLLGRLLVSPGLRRPLKIAV